MTQETTTLIPKCTDAIRGGAHFLSTKCVSSGGWIDIETNHSGASTSWMTAHVLWSVGKLLPREAVEGGVQSLFAQQRTDGGWGFSENTPTDCDSTVHAVCALSNHSKSDLTSPIRVVLNHQLDNGGFCTYRDPHELVSYRSHSSERDFSGWLRDHVCVSSAALQMLSLLESPAYGRAQMRLLEYLKTQQRGDGTWPAYWWHTSIFSTARVLAAGIGGKHKLSFMSYRRAVFAIEEAINSGGYIQSHAPVVGPCMISTALAMVGLISAGLTIKLIDQGISWLLAQQCSDGSWLSTPALRIPPPNIFDPDEYNNWQVGSRGVGSICMDRNRVYTTALVLAALDAYSCPQAKNLH